MTTLLEADTDRLLAAVRALLVQKGIATPEEIAERIESTDAASRGPGLIRNSAR